MNINKNSLFTRFVVEMGMDWHQIQELKKGKMNICQYRSCVIKAFIVSLCLTFLGSLAVVGCIFFLTILLIHPISLYYLDFPIFTDKPYESIIMALVLWSIIILGYIVNLISRIKYYIRYETSYSEYKLPTESKNGFIRFCTNLFKAFKDKYCPMVTYTDE